MWVLTASLKLKVLIPTAPAPNWCFTAISQVSCQHPCHHSHRNTVHIGYWTFYSAHWVLATLHSTVHTDYCTLYSTNWLMYTTKFTRLLYTLQCTLDTLKCLLATLHSTVHTGYCTLHSASCIMYTTQCPLAAVNFIVHNGYLTIFNAH